MNGGTSGKTEQECNEFKHELQYISNSVCAFRSALLELQAGAHQFVEYSFVEEERLKALEDKLLEWENKIIGISQELNNNSITENRHLDNQLSVESGYNGQLTHVVILDKTTDHDGSSFTTTEEPLSKETKTVKNKLAKWESWMKTKEKELIFYNNF